MSKRSKPATEPRRRISRFKAAGRRDQQRDGAGRGGRNQQGDRGISDLFLDRKATIAVVGLGYVGMPLALAAWTAGFRVIGLDTDVKKVETINRGESYISHIPAHEVARVVSDGRFRASALFEEVREADAIIICVPTPLTANREPDLTFIQSTAESIVPHLQRGQLIVLESTTWPGTTFEVLGPILERSGLKSGQDFFLGFSPEREDPGNPHHSTKSIPKVVAGDDAISRKLIAALYGSIVNKVIPVSSTKTAEAVKLTENIFRAVNIALANELKVIFEPMGIDVWEVIETAKTKPFGFMPFYPGPGLGGHCIPIDPFYLSWKAREYEVPTRFIELAGEINAAMPYYVVNRTISALDERYGRGLHGARILIVGIAYKKNVEDTRESPALKLIELFERRGAVVDYYDPYVDRIPNTRKHPDLAGRERIAWDARKIKQYNAVLIVTDHDNIDYSKLCEWASLVIDTRNACARAGVISEKVVKA